MGPEAKFYNYFKKKTPEIIYTRIENTSSLGTPDALCYNENQFYFTLEFKVSRSKKLKSPIRIPETASSEFILKNLFSLLILD